MSVHKIIICGSREWDDDEPIRALLRSRISRLGISRLLVITGGAPGADSLAALVCEDMGIYCAEVSARWRQFGSQAGPMRNGMMLAMSPHEVVAFSVSSSGRTTPGTRNLLMQALALGIRCHILHRISKEN